MKSIDDKREIKEDDFEENYPFTPAISNNTRRINGIKNEEPLYVRYPKELEKKKQNLQKISEEEHKRRDYKFSP